MGRKAVHAVPDEFSRSAGAAEGHAGKSDGGALGQDQREALEEGSHQIDGTAQHLFPDLPGGRMKPHGVSQAQADNLLFYLFLLFPVAVQVQHPIWMTGMKLAPELNHAGIILLGLKTPAADAAFGLQRSADAVILNKSTGIIDLDDMGVEGFPRLFIFLGKHHKAVQAAHGLFHPVHPPGFLPNPEHLMAEVELAHDNDTGIAFLQLAHRKEVQVYDDIRFLGLYNVVQFSQVQGNLDGQAEKAANIQQLYLGPQGKESGPPFLVVGHKSYLITESTRQPVGLEDENPFHAPGIVQGIYEVENFHSPCKDNTTASEKQGLSPSRPGPPASFLPTGRRRWAAP